VVAELIRGLELDDLWQRPVEVLSGGNSSVLPSPAPCPPAGPGACRRAYRQPARYPQPVVSALFVRLVEKSGSALLLVTHNRKLRRSRSGSARSKRPFAEGVGVPIFRTLLSHYRRHPVQALFLLAGIDGQRCWSAPC
jgi:hypothetical protein